MSTYPINLQISADPTVIAWHTRVVGRPDRANLYNTPSIPSIGGFSVNSDPHDVITLVIITAKQLKWCNLRIFLLLDSAVKNNYYCCIFIHNWYYDLALIYVWVLMCMLFKGNLTARQIIEYILSQIRNMINIHSIYNV